MLTVVAYWDRKQVEPELEWRMWRQLRGGFEIDRFVFTPVLGQFHNVSIEQYPTMEECLLKVGTANRAFLEPSGYNSLHDLPQGDCTLIVGNSNNSNMELADVSETYSIAAPNRLNAYGINAAAIALALRYGQ